MRASLIAAVLGILVLAGALLAPTGITLVAASDTPGTALLKPSNNEESPVTLKNDIEYIYATVIGPEGELTGPVRTAKITRTDAEWRAMLTPEQFRIMRNHGTEPAFCGGLLDNKEEGHYLCRGCNLPLFSSEHKFDSGTGWPSYYQSVSRGNILERVDFSHGMTRTEILCPRCESHLGHVFPDGPAPTGLRYCLNSDSMVFATAADRPALAEEVVAAPTAELVLGGGCFWCVEAVFLELDGVVEVTSGYAGGTAETANYRAVSSGRTQHAEVVRIVYDTSRLTMEQLLRVHFATHDPTTLNRQGADVGPQYRSAIFYANEQEKALAAAFIADLTSAAVFESPIVTTLEPLTQYFMAEEYHQNYVCRNPGNPYVRAVALPKVDKLRRALGGEGK